MSLSTSSARLILRDDALAEIGELLRGREHFLIVGFPALSAAVAVLERVDGWTVYLDHGVGTVGVIGGALGLTVLEATSAIDDSLGSVTAVVAKSAVSYRDLMRALDLAGGLELDKKFSPDDERDLILLELDGRFRFRWPVLFVDAVDRIDAVFAARIRATAAELL